MKETWAIEDSSQPWLDPKIPYNTSRVQIWQTLRLQVKYNKVANSYKPPKLKTWNNLMFRWVKSQTSLFKPKMVSMGKRLQRFKVSRIRNMTSKAALCWQMLLLRLAQELPEKIPLRVSIWIIVVLRAKICGPKPSRRRTIRPRFTKCFKKCVTRAVLARIPDRGFQEMFLLPP